MITAPSEVAWRRTFLRWTAYTVFGLAGLALFARFSVASGFDAIPGNVGDARFVLYICEHWHKVFASTAPWLSPPILHPTQNVLGYSEAMFALGAAYSVLRRLGLDPFAAYQAVVLALPFVGYIGAVWLLRRGFGVGSFSAVLGGLLFAYSSPMATSMVHAQLEAVALVPYVAMFLLQYLANLGSRDAAARASGIAFSVLLALLAYTSFYVAWFFVLLACVAVLLVAGWSLARRRGEVLVGWGRLARQSWRSLAVNAVVLALCSIPFVVTYAPVLRLFSRRPWVQEVLPGLPSAIDLVNVGWENAVWGSFLKKIGPGLQLRPGFWELDKGIPLVTLSLFVAVAAYVFSRPAQARPAARHPALVPAARMPAIVMLCAGAVGLAWLLTLKAGDRSLWWLVYRGFPGGGAVRSAYRFNILLMLPLVVVVTYGIDLALERFRASQHRVAGLLAAGLLAGIMVAEQHNEHRDVLSKRDERELLARAPAPPAHCRTMVVTADKDLHDGWWAPLQLHTMLVSQRFGIPTVNGYSGWTPEDWHLHFPTVPGYRDRVRVWATTHGVLDGLCEYHADSRTWRPFVAESPVAIPSSRER